MKISNNSPFLDPKLYAPNGKPNETKMVTGIVPEFKHDTVEISPTGRQLAEGAIEHLPAKYYGTAEIDSTLSRILDGKAPEVSKAVYSLIRSNFITGDTKSGGEEQAALLELGMSQAKYIADNYMTGAEAADFLATMKYIAGISKTRAIDSTTGKVTYTTPPDKPVGAPDDYVNPTDLMKRFEPETYDKFNAAVSSGGNWSSILFGFVKKIPHNKGWAETYTAETNRLVQSLRNPKIDNRFEGADTSNMAAFMKDINKFIQNTSLAHQDILTRNLESFAHLLGYKA